MAQQVQQAAAASTDHALQVVMIGLGDEKFALDAAIVREIIDPVPATRVAGAKPFVPSIINVRGNIVPLADLRLRFGMPLTEASADTRIVVVEIAVEGEPVLVGVIADKVYEVSEIFHADMQQTPRVGVNWKPEFIRCITKWRDEFVIVPNMERILNQSSKTSEGLQ
ncbi:chemotaxis protein CheW [Bradyrhizobium sp. USDA 4353]